MTGPPLKFKAVNTQTGKVVGNLTLLGEQLFYGDDVAICQSTGLHDSKGNEIYFSDVLFYPLLFDDYYFVDYGQGVAIATNGTGEVLLQDVNENSFVIGNQWMPREQLDAKAKEVGQTKSPGLIRGFGVSG